MNLYITINFVKLVSSDMIEFLFMKNDVELKNDLKEYSIVASCSNEPGNYKL